MWFFDSRRHALPTPDETLPGRPEPIPTSLLHHANGARLHPPYGEATQVAMFALGCFWGAEKSFWQTPGVVVTAVGYAGGQTPNPTYGESAPVGPGMPRPCSSCSIRRASRTRGC